MPQSKVRLTLLESTRHTTLHAVVAELVGLSTYAGLVAIGIIGAGVLNRAAPPPDIDQAVSFLAPLRQSAPPPKQESVRYIGLGGLSAFTEPLIDSKSLGIASVPPGSISDKAGEELELPDASTESDKAYSEIEVDSTVTLDPNAEGPQYPPALLEAGVQGVVYVRFGVDTVGHVDTASMIVMDKPHPDFVSAVRTALSRMKYHPAVLRGRAVSQLVEQPFVFRIKPPEPASDTQPRKVP